MRIHKSKFRFPSLKFSSTLILFLCSFSFVVFFVCALQAGNGKCGGIAREEGDGEGEKLGRISDAAAAIVVAAVGKMWKPGEKKMRGAELVDGGGGLKPVEEAKGRANWSEEELKEFDYNSKAMNAIYGAFENLKMEEEEDITQFNGRILEIAGEAYNFGEPIPENMLGRTADFLVYGQGQQRRAVIEAVRLLDNENKGTNSEFCKLNEMPDVKSHNQFKDKSKKWLKFVTQLSDLMGNLKTYELEMLQNKKPNDKGIALQSKQDTNSDEDTEKMEESIALLTKNFNRVLKKFNKFRNKNKSFSNNQGSPSFAQNQSVNPKKKGNPNLDGIQCYECKGNGHIQSECPNYLRRKNKTYVTTLSDDSDSEEENNTNFVAFFTNHEGDDESKEDMQDLLNSYTQLHSKWEEIIKVNLNSMQENHFLKSEKENEILLHKETQEKLMKSLKEEDKLLREIRRLTENVVQPDLATRKDSAVKNREVLQHHFQHRRRIRCYYCHRLRHIKAHCYKRQNDLHNILWAKQE
nr:uncharacterized protein LOC109187072 [Ipomoea batatas]